ncbi:MAG: pyruvate kinase [Candidatus Hodarchaeota archaeon]
MKATKIVCTIGPVSQDEESLKQLVNAGMDVARLNFSHGTHEQHKEVFERIRKIAPNIAILIDLCGPKIRTGPVAEPFMLKIGDEFTITNEDIIGTEESKRVGVNYSKLPSEVSPGDLIHIADGIIRLKVLENTSTDIKCKVEASGLLSSKKGINCSSTKLSLYAPTEKDLVDVKFGMELKTDFFAISFVRRLHDVMKVKQLFFEKDVNFPIISKIEHPEALENFDDILEVSDGIMIARGDLGVEIPTEQVPIVQKDLINRTHRVGKPVIVATQMLESMISSPRPTRAEASDVANAILDGTDAVMLSGETAMGKYPILTVQTMAKIAEAMEESMALATRTYEDDSIFPLTEEILGHAARYIADRANATAIIATSTRTGNTARMISKYRPDCLIIATTPYLSIARQLQLVWGVMPITMRLCQNTDEIMLESITRGYEEKLIKATDKIVAIGGSNVGFPGRANLVQVLEVGKILAYRSISDFQTDREISCATFEERTMKHEPELTGVTDLELKIVGLFGSKTRGKRRKLSWKTTEIARILKQEEKFIKNILLSLAERKVVQYERKGEDFTWKLIRHRSL